MSDLQTIIKTFTSPLAPIDTGMAPRLAKLENIKAAAFDIYGTMLISGSGDIGTLLEKNTENIMRSCLEDVGFELRVENKPDKLSDRFQAHIKTAWDRRKAEGIEYPEVEIREVWKDFLDKLVLENLLKDNFPSAAIEALSLSYECRVNPVWPMPGVHGILSEIRKSGLQLGIVSNAQFYTPLILEELREPESLANFFEPQLCVWSYREREAKPSTRLFAKLADQLRKRDIQPKETLYVGNDMRNDILPAQEIGFKTALFAGDRRSLRMREGDPLCSGIVPDLVITSLDQLPKCL